MGSADSSDFGTNDGKYHFRDTESFGHRSLKIVRTVDRILREPIHHHEHVQCSAIHLHQRLSLLTLQHQWRASCHDHTYDDRIYMQSFVLLDGEILGCCTRKLYLQLLQSILHQCPVDYSKQVVHGRRKSACNCSLDDCDASWLGSVIRSELILVPWQ